MLTLIAMLAGCRAGTSPSSAGTGGDASGGSAGGSIDDMNGGSAGSAAAGGSGGSSAQGGAGGQGGSASGNGGNSANGGTAHLGGAATGGASAGGAPQLPTCANSPASDPAPASTWVNATSNLAGKPAGCVGVGRIIARPCSKRVIVGVEGHGLYSSDDSGNSWQALGTGAGSAAISNSVNDIVFDPAHPDTFWELGIRGSSGLYWTRDGGTTFKQLGALTSSQFIGIDWTDPARKTLLVGTHGGKQQVFRSTDAGQTWTNVGLNLASSVSYAEAPLVIDAQTFLLGVQDCGAGTCGIYRSTNAGLTWTLASPLGVSHFGAPLRASDNTLYWPLGSNGGLAKSTDLGKTWTKIVAANTILGVAPVELPDGSLVTIGTKNLVRSIDHGATWKPIGDTLPFQIPGTSAALTYSVARKTFFLSHWDCGTSVPANGIMSMGFDYTKG